MNLIFVSILFYKFVKELRFDGVKSVRAPDDIRLHAVRLVLVSIPGCAHEKEISQSIETQ